MEQDFLWDTLHNRWQTILQQALNKGNLSLYMKRRAEEIVHTVMTKALNDVREELKRRAEPTDTKYSEEEEPFDEKLKQRVEWLEQKLQILSAEVEQHRKQALEAVDAAVAAELSIMDQYSDDDLQSDVEPPSGEIDDEIERNMAGNIVDLSQAIISLRKRIPRLISRADGILKVAEAERAVMDAPIERILAAESNRETGSNGSSPKKKKKRKRKKRNQKPIPVLMELSKKAKH